MHSANMHNVYIYVYSPLR